MRDPGTPPASSLEQQIRDAERRLDGRRRSASAHLAAAKRRVHAGLSSPATLLLALGVGVALGQFVSTRRARARRAPLRGADAVRGSGALSMLLDALRIAAPIAAMLSTLGAVRTAPQPRTRTECTQQETP